MSKYIFYHIYCCDTTYSILSDQVKKIIFSGLYNTIDCIYCFLTGEEKYIDEMIEYITKCGKKFKVMEIGVDDQSFERFTIHKIKNYILPNDKFLYIHTKGIIREGCKNVDDWRTYMEYFLMTKHNECIKLLDEYDTVGVNLSYVSGMHYSGNFWWCRGSYFLTLPDIKYLMSEIENENRQNPHNFQDNSRFKYTENYLCMRNPKAHCLFSTSDFPHYNSRYLPENYIDVVDVAATAT